MKDLNNIMHNLITESVNIDKFDGIGYLFTEVENSLDEIEIENLKVFYTDFEDLKSIHQKTRGNRKTPVIIKCNIIVENLLYWDEDAKEKYQVNDITSSDYEFNDLNGYGREILKEYNGIVFFDSDGKVVHFKIASISPQEYYIDQDMDDWVLAKS